MGTSLSFHARTMEGSLLRHPPSPTTSPGGSPSPGGMPAARRPGCSQAPGPSIPPACGAQASRLWPGARLSLVPHSVSPCSKFRLLQLVRSLYLPHTLPKHPLCFSSPTLQLSSSSPPGGVHPEKRGLLLTYCLAATKLPAKGGHPGPPALRPPASRLRIASSRKPKCFLASATLSSLVAATCFGASPSLSAQPPKVS